MLVLVRALFILAAALNAALCAVRSEAIYFGGHHGPGEAHHHDHGHSHSHASQSADVERDLHHSPADFAAPHGHDHSPTAPAHIHVGHWYDYLVVHSGKLPHPPSPQHATLPATLEARPASPCLQTLAPPTTRCLGPPPFTRSLPLLI